MLISILLFLSFYTLKIIYLCLYLYVSICFYMDIFIFLYGYSLILVWFYIDLFICLCVGPNWSLSLILLYTSQILSLIIPSMFLWASCMLFLMSFLETNVFVLYIVIYGIADIINGTPAHCLPIKYLLSPIQIISQYQSFIHKERPVRTFLYHNGHCRNCRTSCL